MYYQVLGRPKPFCPPNYRGTYRCGPGYQEDLPETAPVNLAWRSYVDREQQLPDREPALQLAAAFEAIGQAFDVVQVDAVTSNPPAHEVNGQLGFDISQHGWYSLLSWGLHWGEAVPAGPGPVGSLLRILEACFRPRLNEHGLFARWEDARLFLDGVEALATLVPGTWEAPGHETFDIVQVVGLRLPAAGRGAAPTQAGLPEPERVTTL